MSSKKPTALVPTEKGLTSLRRVLGEFEEMVGGRGELVAALSTVDLSSKEATLLELMDDPLRVRDSLLRLCQDAGVGAHALMGLYRQAMTQQAEQILYGGLPRVVKGVLAQATEGMAVCPDCGDSEELGKEACETCKGTGHVWRKANFDHQKLALEATKMLPKGGGMQINVDQRVGIHNSGGGMFDKLVMASDKAAYAVDGEYWDEELKADEGDRSDGREDGGVAGEVQPEFKGDRGEAGSE